MKKLKTLVAGLLAAALFVTGAPVVAQGRSPAGAGAAHQPVRKLTVAEIDLLARVVSAEARGEPYEGQVAVAAVILNRMEHAEFPKTLAGVVYQKHQFESVAIGTAFAPPVPSAVRAARDAVRGWDPTNGAIYFFNPAKTKNKFLWSRPLARIIARHRFTY